MKIRHWIAALAFVVTAHAAEKAPEFRLLERNHKLQPSPIKEASGLAISSADPGFMWIINDSGGTPDIHLTTTDGTYRGKVTLKDAKNVDWEDLDSFTLDGKNYLLVADTGDNDSKRKDRTLHILREPALPADGKSLDATAAAVWKIKFQYEGGPRDCESVGVDTQAGKILLISKRTKPPEVYELPLRPSEKAGTLVAKKIGTTSVKPTVTTILPYQDQPCGLDISADNSLAAVVTYHTVFLFPRQPKESWADAFARQPAALAPHHLGQAESVAFSKDGKSIYTVAEGKSSPIRIYQR
ncbi:hypothetical protein JIN84_11705 [Luteolibacter yonseiensis]|uniref:Integral membrane protein n=1 Tax=Luteolibacter yonseiensis TaxID=1144680 RepID=A0A934R6T5_9BACT|nr:hypothetical protein [Luteolibacter yonseiensis]MBK1816280.1 hypothetical protein [Luteolibacter yonseiensis]